VVDTHLANLSNQLLLGTVLLYVVAMFGYAADLAFIKKPAKVLVGAAVLSEEEQEEEEGRDWGRFAILINVIGWGTHLAAIVTRGLSVDRWPWGNMYEFMVAITFTAVSAYLVLLVRQKVRFLGAFVMVAAVIGLGIATIWLYKDAGALVPALKSYWIAIHVTAAIVASGGFTVSFVATALYLLTARYESKGGESAFYDKLPQSPVFDRLSHRVIIFVFPIWTFAIIAGAIWADQAWGRYWGWDPKETWSFITFVVYAGYLHARATAGWKGQKAAIISLVGYGCLMFNLFGVNIFINGLHSYSGM
jgi:cytochrome c-type biogenesis protein CcsB